MYNNETLQTHNCVWEREWNRVKSIPETKVSHKGSRQQRQHTSLDWGSFDTECAAECLHDSLTVTSCRQKIKTVMTELEMRRPTMLTEREKIQAVLYTAWRFEKHTCSVLVCLSCTPQAASTGVPCTLLTSTTDRLPCTLQSSKYATYKSTHWAMCILPQFNKNQVAIYWMCYIYWIIIQHLTY